MKIKTLTLDNFRAFPGPEPQSFHLDGKNLLVYGENGAGKSSVFHALKTFFTLNHPNSVCETCNVFSGIPDHWIEVEFDDGLPPVRWDGPPSPQPPAWRSDDRVIGAALRRGCLDYRAILDTNYKHLGGDVNLFNIAVNHLLTDFKLAGAPNTIGELWTEVQTATPQTNRAHHVRAAKQACEAFNIAFGDAVTQILPEINNLLPELAADGVQLNQLIFANVAYDAAQRKYVGLSLIPRIIFRSQPITQPHEFLNEARLSALGLALYLAGRLLVPLDSTYIAPQQPPMKLLVLDDVLIGIDLSNRLPLLDLLRERFGDWQIVLLTFDRVWFEMTRLHIQGADEWNCLEVFDRVCAERDIPYPMVRKVKNKAARGCLEDARRFLGDGYEPAAANYTRSAFELALKVFCERFAVPVRYKLVAGHLSAEDYLGAVGTWLDDKQKPFLDATLERVKMFRSVVLNQGSHSAPPTIARSEIEGAILAVEALLKLTEPKSNADVEVITIDKATELAASAAHDDWIASLGYLRGALAVRVRKFCKDKKIPIAFGERSVKALWKTVYDNHTNLFTGPIANVPADIERDRDLFVEAITDNRLQNLTQADLQRLIGILNRWH